MNSHDFRVWVKNIDSDFIKQYNIKPANFKAVCYSLSMYGDYETGTSVRPSWLTVAKESCVNRKTAMKVRDVLLQIGILKQVSKTEANISVYEYCELSIQGEQLSKSEDQLSNTDNQLSSLVGHNTTNIYTTKDSTFNTKNYRKPGKESWKYLSLSSLD
jgi:cellobiose phosphorylase